jgi:hypothetical protein
MTIAERRHINAMASERKKRIIKKRWGKDHPMLKINLSKRHLNCGCLMCRVRYQRPQKSEVKKLLPQELAQAV